MSKRTRAITEYGILIALAMVLSYIEATIPAFFAIPGMKIGLTNIVVLTALYMKGPRSAMAINILRIILVSFLFGNGISLAYSLAGGLLSGIVMILLKRMNRFGITIVSICGGIAHNIGQILVAMFIMQTAALAYYLLILWFTGMATGAVIGLIGGMLVGRLEKLGFGGKKP